MDALMAISGCGPGFVFAIAAALRDAGVAAGLDRDQADFLVRETLLGSTRLLARTGAEPEALRDQVASPQGTTHAGLMVLHQRDLPGLLRATVLAARDRAAELARQG
jgi:pyrroline-5-carboxylate reductase